MQIPIEGERLRDNDLVVEQFLSPVSPAIAGFRIDAFNIIRPRVTHSPMNTVDGYSTLIEDRYIVPAVLYIQAAVVQVIISNSQHSVFIFSFSTNIASGNSGSSTVF